MATFKRCMGWCGDVRDGGRTGCNEWCGVLMQRQNCRCTDPASERGRVNKREWCLGVCVCVRTVLSLTVVVFGQSARLGRKSTGGVYKRRFQLMVQWMDAVCMVVWVG